jgi:hypothetical protein
MGIDGQPAEKPEAERLWGAPSKVASVIFGGDSEHGSAQRMPDMAVLAFC